jgi:hypothetical protein
MISVFTALSESGNAYIEAAFETLLRQTHTDWEWIVLENHGGRLPEHIGEHPRVRVFEDGELEGLGALKRACRESALRMTTPVCTECAFRIERRKLSECGSGPVTDC